MAVNITEPGTVLPDIFTQAKDPIAFRLKSSNTITAPGEKAQLKLSVSGGISAFNTMEIESPLFGLKSWIFLPVAWLPQESGYALPEYPGGSLSAYTELIAENLRLNPYLANYYLVEAIGQDIFITANEIGSLYHLNYVGDSSSNLSGVLMFTGWDKEFQPNMALLFHLWARTAGFGPYSLRTVSIARPDPNAWFTHDIHELLLGQTSFNLHPFNTGLIEERAIQWYINLSESFGDIPDTYYSKKISLPKNFHFYTYRGGSARLNTSDFNEQIALRKWLKRFDRKDQKMIRGPKGRYFISIVNLAKQSLRIRITYTLADGSVTDYLAYNIGAPRDGAVYTFECGPQKVAMEQNIDENELIRYVIEAEMDGIFTGWGYRAYVIPEEYECRAFWFESSFGVTETLICNGNAEIGIEVNKEEFRAMFPAIKANETSRELYQRLNHFTDTGTVFTGFMDVQDLRDFVTDLLISENAWTHGISDPTLLYRVYINPESFSLIRRDDFLYGVSFSYKRTLIKQAHSDES
jgi:hypothetical protein